MFFSRSVLASEEGEEPQEAYERGSTEYKVFRELAEWDESFRRLLTARNIDPEDPCPRSAHDRDQFFRKVKPVALLRQEFSSKSRGRSRKALTIYGGKEAVFAMSEGNPRWLRGLLNDFTDLGRSQSGVGTSPVAVRYSDQAKVLNTAGQRFLALIKASPFKQQRLDSHVDAMHESTLLNFVETIGAFFRNEVYRREFPLDPIGSFEVPQHADASVLFMIDQLLELGGLVYIGSSPQDIPVAIPGSRFRLSFILAPVFKLALRTYRETDLDAVLSGIPDPYQLNLGI